MSGSETAIFFGDSANGAACFRQLEAALLLRYPSMETRVQKTQITFSNRRVYACVSFLRVKRKAELPGSWFTLSLGLPYALESPRVAAKVEPYPGRWTTHIVLSDPSELDAELLAWVEQAYAFAESKA